MESLSIRDTLAHDDNKIADIIENRPNTKHNLIGVIPSKSSIIFKTIDYIPYEISAILLHRKL
jgi:hypothetical protein